MSSKLLHIILFALLSVVVMVDRHEQKRESDKIEEEYSQTRAKHLADEAVIAASQMTEAPSASTSQYAPPPTNQEVAKISLDQFPFPPPDETRVKLSAQDGKPFDCQNRNVDLMPDGGEFTLVGYCPFVRVIGPHLQVKIQSAHVLEVYAPDAMVDVENVNFIDVIAPNAHVVYGSALHPNAKVIVQVTGSNASAFRR